MRILYDISVMGSALKNNKSRTGVFRVVESLARELIKNEDIELIFCSNNNLNSIRDCLIFLESSNEFKNVRFLYPSQYQFPLSIANCINNIQAKLGKFGRVWLIQKIVAHGISKFLFFYEKYLVGEKQQVFSPTDSIDIFHSPFLEIPSGAPKKHFRKSFITIHDMLPVLFPNYFLKSITDIMRRAYASIDKNTWVLCVSEATRQDLLKYKENEIDPKKVFVTSLAAADHFYKSNDLVYNSSVLKRYKIPHKPYVLGLSTLEPKKNIPKVIDAFTDLLKEHAIEDLNLVLVGPKGHEAKLILNKISNQPQLRSRIIVTGFIPDEHLAAIYSEAMMFVYASFHEGFGLPPLEAMQCGVPVITSNTSSLPEVVGDAAIMIDPNKKEQITNAMFALYNDRKLHEELSAKGIERSKLFSWKKCANQTAKIYKLSLDDRDN